MPDPVQLLTVDEVAAIAPGRQYRMATVTGTDGGTITAAHDEHGVYVSVPYRAAHLSPDAARRLAADLLALADLADSWMHAATEPYRSLTPGRDADA